MKGGETSLLYGVEGPSLAVIEQHADVARPVDCTFGVYRKLSVQPESQGQPVERGGSSSNPSVEISA